MTSGGRHLEPNVVEVWTAPLDVDDETLRGFRDTLTEDELHSADRKIRVQDQRRCAASRGHLRQILSRYLDVSPAEPRFCYGEHGKPELESHPGIHFNVSHSRDLGAFAITCEDEVGVDIEWVRGDLEHEKLAHRYFSPTEADALSLVPEEERLATFFRIWTRKEAFIKAKGVGLALPLNRFEVSLDRDTPRLLATRPDEGEATRWTLENVPGLPEDCLGAVAARFPFALRCRALE